jgi:NADH-quinone oxidoreductase subunit G
MPEIILDGRRYTVEPGRNLLQTVLSLGLDLPYFCWHPALGSVGACRQCAVVQYQGEQDTKGRIVMACMTPVAEGLRADLEAPAAREFRAAIIECLMTGHPHDCPVCEEGGECHLQDMTVMTGHTVRRYRGLKRTYRNQYLGPFLNHEMNRCIACYRCVRFYRDYAGGGDLQVFALRNRVYFGRSEDGVLDSEFSGNLAEVCPTGVYTDRTFGEHYVRKWDQSFAPSVCVHCAVGCNTSPGERLGLLRRILNRYHGAVNGYFLCDRGRFGYGFVNGARRLRDPLLRGGRVVPEAAVAHLAGFAAGRTLGIGSPRASLEANFALRELVGAENFYAGFSRTEAALAAAILEVLGNWPVRVPTVREMEQADAVLVLGEDVPNTAPRLALALRQAVRNRAFERADALRIPRWLDSAVRDAAQGLHPAPDSATRQPGYVRAGLSPLFIATPAATRLEDVAAATLRGTPEEIARLGFAVAHALDSSAPAVPDLAEDQARLAEAIAQTLAAARRPLVVSGTGCQSFPVVRAAANVARALAARNPHPGPLPGGEGERNGPHPGPLPGGEGVGSPLPEGEGVVDLCYVVPECNTLGLALMDGRSVEDAFALVEQGRADRLVVLENDLYRRADPLAVERCLERLRHLAVMDHTRHATADRAELLLPSPSFVETGGTLVSLEGRAQRFFAVMPPGGEARDVWCWVAAALRRNWLHLDAVTAACAGALPVFGPILAAAPPAGFRIEGGKIPRQSARFSGRTAMNADWTLHEPKPPDDADSALSYSMEGAGVNIPPPLRPVFWAPRWNSHQQATAKFQDEVGGPLRGGDPGVRLIEPAASPKPRWFEEIPSGSRDPSRWRAVPLYHVFGSEELSLLAPPVAERVPPPYAALHPDAAAALGLTDRVPLRLGEGLRVLPLRLDASLPRGVVGLPVGLPGGFSGDLPIWVRIETTETEL